MTAKTAIAGRQDGAGRPGESSRNERLGSGRLGDRSGATLFEVILVVILMGVLAAVAVPRFARSNLWGVEGEAGAKETAATLRLARRMAIDRAATRPNGFYVVCSGASYYVCSTDTGAVEGETKTLPDGWTFQKGYKVNFNALGAATGLASGDSIVVQGHGTTWCVAVVAATGSVRYWKSG